MEEIVQPRAKSGKKSKKKLNKQDPTPPQSACRTRSQAAPDWTQQETLVLVSVIVAVDEDWLNSLSSYQKWKMISEESTGLGVHRSSHQCKRRWESLVADYGRISDWEPRPGVGSYWSLDSEGRTEYGLPPLFDREVFDSMDAAIKAWEDRSVSRDSGTEDLVEMVGADVDSGPTEVTPRKTWKDEEKGREAAAKLRETVERVNSVLRGELTSKDSRGRGLVDMTKPNAVEMEFARRQADELIGAVDDLVGTLSCFTELIEDCE